MFNNTDNIYNHTSISKQFKNYCSTIICEVLTIIGKMIKVEIESRSVKTVNDSVIKTILEQLHIANSIEFGETSEFINKISKKYNEYLENKKTENASGKPIDGSSDIKYEKE